MVSLKGIRWLLSGLVGSCLLFAAPPSAEPSKIESLAKARHESAVKQYNETWAYYQQARIDSYQVYVWSRIVLDCRRDMAKNQRRPDHRSGRASWPDEEARGLDHPRSAPRVRPIVRRGLC